MSRKRIVFALLIAFIPAAARPAAAAQDTAKKITFEQAYGAGLREGGGFRMGGMFTWLDDEHYLVREFDEKTKAMRSMKGIRI